MSREYEKSVQTAAIPPATRTGPVSAPRGLSGVSRRSLLTGIPAALLRAQERPPNFLVIIADDHGWDDVGCYGHPVVGTPNLDRLASDGVRFTHCFTTAPLCSPGRGAVMSGLYPHVSGVTRLVQGEDADRLSMRPDLWTFAKGLKGLGYETAAARKWHLSTAGPTAHGFDQEFPSRVEYLDQSVAFLERHHTPDRFAYIFARPIPIAHIETTMPSSTLQRMWPNVCRPT